MRAGKQLAVLVALLLLVACRKGAGETAAKKLQEKVTTRTIHLFYEAADLRLMAEDRTLSLPENDAVAAEPVVAQLLKGPAAPGLGRLFPADATVRAVYLLPDGNAVVDLGGQTLMAGWNTGSHTEMMAIYSLVETLTSNFPTVKRVRILINGQQAETLGGHIAIGKSVTRHAALVR